ncbi:hypothetical protein SDC9_136126 [bioreactor metagenome]|uniref:Uncharacterized protein n=1 Tax=bioreactor metagenome TaxID=1076179 RepID=A0A645DJ10_9ZZZZ
MVWPPAAESAAEGAAFERPFHVFYKIRRSARNHLFFVPLDISRRGKLSYRRLKRVLLKLLVVDPVCVKRRGGEQHQQKRQRAENGARLWEQLH